MLKYKKSIGMLVKVNKQVHSCYAIPKEKQLSRCSLDVNFWLKFCNVVTFKNSATKEFFRCWCDDFPSKEVIRVVVQVFGGVRAVCGRGGMFIPAYLGYPVGFTNVVLSTGTSSFVDTTWSVCHLVFKRKKGPNVSSVPNNFEHEFSWRILFQLTDEKLTVLLVFRTKR